MWTSAVVLSMFSVAFASELELFDNGWMPVSSDIVFNQIQREITQAPRYTKADDVQIVDSNGLSIVSKHEEYEEVGHKEDIDEDTDICNSEESGATIIGDKIEQVPRFEYNFEPNMFQPSENQNVKTEESVRRPKKLKEKEPIVDNEMLPKYSKAESKNTLQGDSNQLQEKTDDNTHTYEVTENIIIENLKQDEPILVKRGYEFKPPDKQNFTNSLNKYLSNYNIRDSDNLQNYALSRRKPKNYIHVKQNALHKPLRFLIPMRYNSLNHLPVDPLLAVFLSNYGYYLQGQYGIHNNYNNLYGYLASNNIHNNRPFGFYKLYSDTDSSQ